MRKNWKTIAISLPIGALFVWLAVKNVNFDEIGDAFSKIQYGWIPAFILISTLSYMLRAERWMLLLGEEREKANRSTFYAGTMFGYLMNYVIPRIGEVSRCVYVSKKDGIPTLKLIGTVVLERVIDTLMLLLMVIFLFVYVITDSETIIRLFGEKNAELILGAGSWQTALIGLGLILIVLTGYLLVHKLLSFFAKRESLLGKISIKILGLIQVFIEGLSNIKKVHNWPYFVILTIAMWVCYVMMTYVPFSMFNMQETFHLGIADAATLMVLAAIGVALPSPGGIGTYHWFVKQTLFVLFAVPESEGLVYAFVTHSSMLVLVLLISPIFIGINSFINRKKSR